MGKNASRTGLSAWHAGGPKPPILEKFDKNVTFFNGILLYNIGESHIQVILFDLARIICG
jgi:hypothetical protein